MEVTLASDKATGRESGVEPTRVNLWPGGPTALKVPPVGCPIRAGARGPADKARRERGRGRQRAGGRQRCETPKLSSRSTVRWPHDVTGISSAASPHLRTAAREGEKRNPATDSSVAWPSAMLVFRFSICAACATLGSLDKAEGWDPHRVQHQSVGGP
ncbi:hypothetical protein ANO11243_044720 [Dothideomycetidae sp. 11243]|nr:hypothetical protein ANO11243_044720 [fungal sp. No.11243]